MIGFGASEMLTDSAGRVAVVGATSNRAGVFVFGSYGEFIASTTICSPTNPVYAPAHAVGDRAGRLFLIWDTPEVRCVSMAPGLTSIWRLGGGWGYDSFRSAVPDEAGGVYAAFNLSSTSKKHLHYFGYRTDVTNFQSELTGDSYTALVARAPSGNVYLVGSYGWSRYAGLRIVSYRSTGELVWDKTLPGPTNEFAYAAACDSAGNLLIAGIHRDKGGPGPWGFHPFLLKMSTGGGIGWRTVPTNSGGYGPIAMNGADEIYVSGNGGIWKYSAGGQLIWRNPEINSYLQLTPQDEVVAAASDGDGTVLRKLTSSGEEKWRTEVALVSSGERFCNIAVNTSGDVYVTSARWFYPTGAVPAVPIETFLRKYVDEPAVTVVHDPVELPELTFCDVLPPPPPAEATATRLSGGKMQVCWRSTYADYRLEATRHVNRRKPERTRWHPVSTTINTNSESCCVTVRTARYGTHFRIVPP